MKELPILFSGDMVRATLDGRKTQTRRVMKPQPQESISEDFIKGVRTSMGWCWAYPGGQGATMDIGGAFSVNPLPFCPFGLPGDRLWVKERQRVLDIRHGRDCTDEGTCAILVRYEADGVEQWHEYPERLKWNPVIGHCLPYGGFRESSRITRILTDVRVERVQDITDDACWAEGIPDDDPNEYQDAILAVGAGLQIAAGSPERHWFGCLWDRCNKPGFKWLDNPWAWVVAFTPEPKR